MTNKDDVMDVKNQLWNLNNRMNKLDQIITMLTNNMNNTMNNTINDTKNCNDLYDEQDTNKKRKMPILSTTTTATVQAPLSAPVSLSNNMELGTHQTVPTQFPTKIQSLQPSSSLPLQRLNSLSYPDTITNNDNEMMMDSNDTFLFPFDNEDEDDDNTTFNENNMSESFNFETLFMDEDEVQVDVKVGKDI